MSLGRLVLMTPAFAGAGYDAIEPGLGRDLVRLAAEGEASIGDLEREVLLHLVLVDHRADRQADRGRVMLCGSFANSLGNARQLMFRRLQ